MVVPRLHTELQGGCKCYVSSPVAKNFGFGLKIMTGTTVFGCLPGAHPYWTQKSFKINNFYIIDWIRKKLLVDVANLATCCHDDCDVLLEVWEPCANAMLVVLLPKLWFWIPHISKQKTQHTHKKKNAVLLEWSWNILNVFDILLSHMVQLGQRVVHVETTQAVASIKWGPG